MENMEKVRQDAAYEIRMALEELNKCIQQGMDLGLTTKLTAQGSSVSMQPQYRHVPDYNEVLATLTYEVTV